MSCFQTLVSVFWCVCVYKYTYAPLHTYLQFFHSPDKLIHDRLSSEVAPITSSCKETTNPLEDVFK